MSKLSLVEFADKINELMPQILKGFSRRQSDELFKGKITLPQFLLLGFLHKRGACKMKELAFFLRVTTAAVTGVVDRLVKYGYARRVYEPQDRRVIKIELTSKGGGLLKKIYQQRRQMIIDIFGKISQEERENYLKILTRINEILSEEESIK